MQASQRRERKQDCRQEPSLLCCSNLIGTNSLPLEDADLFIGKTPNPIISISQSPPLRPIVTLGSSLCLMNLSKTKHNQTATCHLHLQNERTEAPTQLEIYVLCFIKLHLLLVWWPENLWTMEQSTSRLTPTAGGHEHHPGGSEQSCSCGVGRDGTFFTAVSWGEVVFPWFLFNSKHSSFSCHAFCFLGCKPISMESRQETCQAEH